MDFKGDDGADQVDLEFADKYSGVFEYSTSGWLKFEKSFKIRNLHSIVRLTQNPPDIQRDFQIPGDRTLAVFLNPTSYVFSTYDYGDLETSEDDVGKTE